MLTARGFELTGGRVLPGDDGTIVEYMYRNASGERLTVCVATRTTEAATTAFRLYRDGPVKVYYWADGRFSYAVSGGMSAQMLLHVSHDVYAQLTGAT
jgi:anti-sigma factor RsiW